MADRRSERRANAGNPDPKPAKKPVAHGAPLSTPRPTNIKRPTAGPADAATRRREIARRVQEGKDASARARANTATKTEAPKPKPETIGEPGRSTYHTIRDRGKDTDDAVDRAQEKEE